MEKPDYLILAEWMGESESLEELTDKCHRIIDSNAKIEEILHNAALQGEIRESIVKLV